MRDEEATVRFSTTATEALAFWSALHTKVFLNSDNLGFRDFQCVPPFHGSVTSCPSRRRFKFQSIRGNCEPFQFFDCEKSPLGFNSFLKEEECNSTCVNKYVNDGELIPMTCS